MLSAIPDYNKYSDNDWIRVLSDEKQDNNAVKYFFYSKCCNMLNFIVGHFYKEENISFIIGEFYEYLRRDDCKVLKAFKGKNNATLSTYLSQCFINHITKKVKQEQREREEIEYYNIADELDNIAYAETDEEMPINEAFKKLDERDKIVLRLLIIKGYSVLEAADTIWPYINSAAKDWRDLTAKEVQTTIGIVKRRALLSLIVKLKGELNSRGMAVPAKITNVKNKRG